MSILAAGAGVGRGIVAGLTPYDGENGMAFAFIAGRGTIGLVATDGPIAPPGCNMGDVKRVIPLAIVTS